jgi:rare lipoprotein A
VLNAPSGARTAPAGSSTTPVSARVPAIRAPAPPVQPLVSTTTPEPTQIYIQAGSFEDAENAQRLTGRLGAYFQGAHVQSAKVSGKTFYRVRIGPITDVDNADRLLERVIVAGYPGSRIVLD